MITIRSMVRLCEDDRSGFRGASRLMRFSSHLHRNSRGNIALLFVFLGLVFFTGASMVWNTGQTTAARVHAQTAADAAAYSSALWNSRAVNTITGTNMLILRNASAMATSIDVIYTAIMIPIKWEQWARQMASPCGPYFPACYAAAWGYILLTEGAPYFDLISSALPAAIEGLQKFPGRLDELFEYERAWVEAVPDAVEENRKALEEYYGVDLEVTQPGLDGSVEPPLRQGNFGTILIPLLLRFNRADAGWPKDSGFKSITIGRATRHWKAGGLIGTAAAAALVGDGHYVLTSYSGVFEQPPNDPEDWADFSVVATARLDNASRNFIAPGIFREPVTPGGAILAYAQAETINGISGRLGKFDIPIFEQVAEAYPFRVWTTYGWQWQARLTRGDMLGKAIESDETMREWFAAIDVDASSTDGWESLDDLTLH